LRCDILSCFSLLYLLLYVGLLDSDSAFLFLSLPFVFWSRGVNREPLLRLFFGFFSLFYFLLALFGLALNFRLISPFVTSLKILIG